MEIGMEMGMEMEVGRVLRWQRNIQDGKDGSKKDRTGKDKKMLLHGQQHYDRGKERQVDVTLRVTIVCFRCAVARYRQGL